MQGAVIDNYSCSSRKEKNQPKHEQDNDRCQKENCIEHLQAIAIASLG
jgi:hypothetical protein